MRLAALVFFSCSISCFYKRFLVNYPPPEGRGLLALMLNSSPSAPMNTSPNLAFLDIFSIKLIFLLKINNFVFKVSRHYDFSDNSLLIITVDTRTI